MTTIVRLDEHEIPLNRLGHCSAGHIVEMYLDYDRRADSLLYIGDCLRCDPDGGRRAIEEDELPRVLRDLDWIASDALPPYVAPVGATRLLETLHKRIPVNSDGLVCWPALALESARRWSSTEQARVSLAHSLTEGALATACGSFDQSNWLALSVAMELQRSTA